MTITDFTTALPAIQNPPAWEVLAAVRAFKAGIGVANVTAAAQRAGDIAYDLADAAGLSNGELVDAYHVAFVDTARELGDPIPCACDYCTTQKGGH